jgi:hypothetical protein
LAASRKPEGPGEFAPNPSGFGFVRWKGIGLAKPSTLNQIPSGRMIQYDCKPL